MAQPRRWQFGPFEVDEHEHSLLRDGRVRPLTHKSFSLLVALLARAGQLVTKAELFETVWAGRAVSDAALARALRELRVALGDDAGRPQSPFHLSAELAVVSDYRRGGVTQSDNDPALQGRIDLRHDSGWSLGAFATSMHARRGSNAQIALSAAQRFDLGAADLSLGATTVIFIGGDADPFAIAQASVSHPIGPVDATLAVNYAPPQAAIHDEHGLNVSLRARTPLGRLNGAPLTAAASVGRSEGEFAMGAETKLDWSLGVTAEIESVEIGLAYVDNDLDDERGEAGLVFSIAHEF